METSGRVKSDIVCDEATDVAAITREDFEKCIGGSFDRIVNHNDLINGLAKVTLFKGLGARAIQALADICRTVHFRDGATL